MSRRFFCRFFYAALCSSRSSFQKESPSLSFITGMGAFFWSFNFTRTTSCATLRRGGLSDGTISHSWSGHMCRMPTLPSRLCDKKTHRRSLLPISSWEELRQGFSELMHKCRVYEFTLECQLSRGELEVSLLDEDRRMLLRLNPASPSGSIVLDAKHRYNLLWKFDHVTGKCKLHW